MIKAENLSYSYPLANGTSIKAFENINFEVKSGEILGIAGKTGSGKSTLASVLSGLLPASGGRVLLRGKDIKKDFKNKKEVFLKIGLAFQYPEHQFFESTVFDDIAFGLRNKGLNEAETKDKIHEISEFLEINESVLSSCSFNLSGGEKRKCAIAGVLVMKPEVLILDEPTAALDYKSKKSLTKYLKNYIKKEKSCMIIISHVMEEIAETASKILVLEKGQQIYYDTPEKVFKNEKHLENLGLEVPQVMKIMNLVKTEGYAISENILSVNKAKSEISRLLGIGGEKID